MLDSDFEELIGLAESAGATAQRLGTIIQQQQAASVNQPHAGIHSGSTTFFGTALAVTITPDSSD